MNYICRLFLLLSIAFGTLGLSASYKAQALPFDDADTTTNYFEKLLTLFNGGSAVSPGQFDGWWSGRCYSNFDVSTPQNQILIFNQTTQPVDDHGPLFPEKPIVEYRFVALNLGKQPANYFDELDESKIKSIQEALPYWLGLTSPAHISDKNFIVEMKDTDTQFYRAQLRKYNSYLVLKFERVVGSNEEAKNTHNCYFFKRHAGL